MTVIIYHAIVDVKIINFVLTLGDVRTKGTVYQKLFISFYL
jgi:hypothetical protein